MLPFAHMAATGKDHKNIIYFLHWHKQVPQVFIDVKL